MRTNPGLTAHGAGAAGSQPGLRLAVVGLAWPAEPFVERLLVGLAEAGVGITIGGIDRPPAEWLTDHGIEWRLLPWVGRRDVVRRQREDTTAARHWRDLVSPEGLHLTDYDVLYVPWINVALDHSDIFDAGRPVVVSLRGTLVNVAPWNPERRALRDGLPAVFARAAAVHCVSEDIRAVAAQFGLDPSKAAVIPPAVETTTLPVAPEAGKNDRSRALRVIAVGRVNWVKDYGTTLLAVQFARQSGIDAHLTIVGDGPELDRLRFTADDLGITDDVRFTGAVPPARVQQLLVESDVFLHTSCSEGISNAVLEAMAVGLAVVTTDAGGMTEAVADGVDGFVVPVRDSGAAGRALVRLARDDVLRTRVAAHGRERARTEFALTLQIERFRSLFESLAG